MERTLEINGKVALVTGGTRGLGLAIAGRLAALRAQVAVADRDAEGLAALPKGMTGFQMDVTRPDQVKAVVAAIVERFERIDILVNNAGVISSEPFVNVFNPDNMMHDFERFRSCLDVNLSSVFLVTSAVVEQMVLHRWKGVIVNISSISAQGNSGQTAYAAAKAGVNAMTVTWAKELGRMGIRCNAVAPGFIDTPSTRDALSPSVIKHIQTNTPLQRLGQPEEVAQAVCSVIDNDFMNGVVLGLDGGLTF